MQRHKVYDSFTFGQSGLSPRNKGSIDVPLSSKKLVGGKVLRMGVCGR